MTNPRPPSFRCTACGYRSTNADFFRLEPGGRWETPQRVCVGCIPYRPEGQDRHWVSAWFYSRAIPALLAHIVIDRSGGSLLLSLVAIAATLAAGPIATFIHELGHAAGIQLVGYRLTAIEMGSGPQLWARRVGGVSLVIRRRVLMGGRARLLCLSGRQSRWRMVILFAAGGLANIAAAALLISLLAEAVDRAPNGGPTFLGALVLGLITANFWCSLTTLFPNERGGEDDSTGNDGAQILSQFRRQKPQSEEERLFASLHAHNAARMHKEAAALAERLLPRRTSDPWLLATLLDLHTRLYGADVALARHRAIVTFGPPQPCEQVRGPTEAWFQANLACIMALASGPHDQALIETLARAAMAGLGENAITKGTLGAALCLSGPTDEGEAMLLDALRGSESNLDRADFCRFLARAALRRRNEGLAAEFEALRRHALAAAA